MGTWCAEPSAGLTWDEKLSTDINFRLWSKLCHSQESVLPQETKTFLLGFIIVTNLFKLKIKVFQLSHSKNQLPVVALLFYLCASRPYPFVRPLILNKCSLWWKICNRWREQSEKSFHWTPGQTWDKWVQGKLLENWDVVCLCVCVFVLCLSVTVGVVQNKGSLGGLRISSSFVKGLCIVQFVLLHLGVQLCELLVALRSIGEVLDVIVAET